jgi:hypothetical protein
MSCVDKMLLFLSLWQVVSDIKVLLHSKSQAAEPDATPKGEPTYVALFSTLAWQCASTLRCEAVLWSQVAWRIG